MRALCRTNEATSTKRANLSKHKTIDNYLYGFVYRIHLILRQSRADEAVNAIQSNDDNLFSASLYLRSFFHFFCVCSQSFWLCCRCARIHFVHFIFKHLKIPKIWEMFPNYSSFSLKAMGIGYVPNTSNSSRISFA